MSIPIDSQCIQCHLRRNLETARRLGTEAQATAFAKDLMKLYLSAPEDVSSPWLAPMTAELFQKHYGTPEDRFREEKEISNRFVLERLDGIRARVEGAEDSLLAGLRFAILGNYIDFSALQGQVSFEELDGLLDRAEEMTPAGDGYAHLRVDLQKAKHLLYLTDNAGEIGFDRVFAEVIAKEFPQLEITFCVRGGPAMNDALRADAALMGIPFPVIDNGNRVAGTQIDQLSREARAALEAADVVIAKGQGNVETMYGCGYNVYYAFLIKCDRFVAEFGQPKLTPMLLRERA